MSKAKTICEKVSQSFANLRKDIHNLTYADLKAIAEIIRTTVPKLMDELELICSISSKLQGHAKEGADHEGFDWRAIDKTILQARKFDAIKMYCEITNRDFKGSKEAVEKRMAEIGAN